jgi:hypothetical protein
VKIKSTTIFNPKQVVIKETVRPITPFGGLFLVLEFFKKINLARKLSDAFPFEYTSPNAISASQTFTYFLLTVLCGAKRFAHTLMMKADDSLRIMTGMNRFPNDDTIRNMFKKFGMKENYEFFANIWSWLLERVEQVHGGLTMDLDSTVFVRYGEQEGSKKGYNSKKRGRCSHHPIIAVLSEVNFILNGWLRSGNTGSSSGIIEFMKESLSLCKKLTIRTIRADSGFFCNKLMAFLESENLKYIIAARMTKHVKDICYKIKDWQEVDKIYSAGELNTALWGWDRSRRFIVIREQIQESKESMGKYLLYVPGYTFRVFATNLDLPPVEIWRDYNLRGNMENVIKELKLDLSADTFCMKQFFSTEAVFKSILLLYNLMVEFRKASGITKYNQCSTLRNQILLCGATVGSAGHNIVIYLSKTWGGLGKRISLLNNILSYDFSTSPKLIYSS